MKPSEVRARFRSRGQTIRDWANQHSFAPGLVYAVLAGRVIGERGRAHDIAVALGIKPDPSNIEIHPSQVRETDMT